MPVGNGRPPLGKRLTFSEVATLEEFRGIHRHQVRKTLLALDKELDGRLLSKEKERVGGKIRYHVTLANLRALVPALFPEQPKKDEGTGELEGRVLELEETTERQAKKIGSLAQRLEVLEGMLCP